MSATRAESIDEDQSEECTVDRANGRSAMKALAMMMETAKTAREKMTMKRPTGYQLSLRPHLQHFDESSVNLVDEDNNQHLSPSLGQCKVF